MKEWKGCQISNDEFWPEQSKIIKICTLIGYFCPKHTMFELKKVQTSYVWWHWRLVQNLKKNWLVLSRMTWRIWQIFIHRLKNSYFILKQLNLFTTFTKYSIVNLWQGLNICWVWNISGFWAFQDCQYAKVLNFQGYTEYLFL